MPITEHTNHLCNIVVETGAEPLEYHCSEAADTMSSRISDCIANSRSLVVFTDKANHTIFVRARKVLAVETVYSA